jgi:predicted CXXCH cytochrome family protein
MSQPAQTKPVRTPDASWYKLFFFLMVVGFAALNFVLWYVASKPGVTLMPEEPRGPGPYQHRPDELVYSGYAGSQGCRDCHRAAFDKWQGSHHGLAERSLVSALDRAAFVPTRNFSHGTQQTSARMVDGRYEVVTAGLAGTNQVFPLVRVLGETPLRQFLVAEARGRYQITEASYDPRTNEWFNVYGQEDRLPGEWGHWTGRGMTWNVMCAYCHNTRVRKNYEPETDTYRTRMAEMGVGCESCHGPMGAHMAWQKKHPNQKGDPAVLRFSSQQTLDTCGSCHARRGDYTGDFHPGEDFFDHFALSIPDETDIFYPDGQIRDEDYEFTAFLGSRMFHSGVRCLDCHDPHAGKVRAKDDSLCLRCHAQPVAPAPKIEVGRHSFHKPGTPGDRCVDCHMPQTVYMQRHWRRDHGFTIPDPLLTKEHNLPNACNRCHQDRTTDWALQYTTQWYSNRMDRPYRQRSRILARAKAGDDTVVPELMAWVRQEPMPQWRAVGVNFLRRWVDQPAVSEMILASAADTNAQVRAMVARALEPLAQESGSVPAQRVQQLLDDPVRAVRIEAAWSARRTLGTNHPVGRELLAYFHANADQVGSLMQQGVFHLDRNEAAQAQEKLHRAISLDGHSAPLRHALAVVYSAQNRPQDALAELQAACRLAPREAEYRFKLALAWNEAGQPGAVITNLEQAVRLDPAFMQAWYNLGLALAATRPDQALEALERAEKLSPQNAQAPYARATILYQQGRITETRRAVQRVLTLQPNHSEARQLWQTLEK